MIPDGHIGPGNGGGGDEVTSEGTSQGALRADHFSWVKIGPDGKCCSLMGR